MRELAELPGEIRLFRALVRELVHYYENNEGPGPANALVTELRRQRDELLRAIDESGRAFIRTIDDREAVLAQIKAERDELGKALSERDRDVVQLRAEVERLQAESEEACADCPPELKTWRKAWRALKRERKAHVALEAELQAKVDELELLHRVSEVTRWPELTAL